MPGGRSSWQTQRVGTVAVFRRVATRPDRSRWRSRLVALAVLAALLVPVGAAEALVESTPLVSDGTDHPVGAIGRVSDIAEANGKVYLVGDFTGVGGETRHYAAAIDKATGQVDPNWNPNLNGIAYTVDVAPDGSAVYVGGKFTKVDSTWRARIAKLDPETGQAFAGWNPKASAKVMTVTATDDTIYIGGYFATVGGIGRASLAAIDDATATVVAGWNPGADGAVLSSTLSPDGALLYVGGNFDTLGGASRLHLGAVTAAGGSVTSWNPAPLHKVLDAEVSADGATLYTAVGGPQVQGGNRATAYATNDGAQVWDHASDGDFQAVAVADDAVYYGGHFIDIEGNARQRLAAFDPASGDLLNWNPGANSGWGVWALTYTDRLYVGGDFTTLGGRTRKHFGMFSNGQNLAPTAILSAGCAVLTCQFDGADSIDPDGTIVTHVWDFGDGTTGTGLTPTHTYDDPGTYTVTLTVTDDDGAADSSSDSVQVSEAGNGIDFVAAAGAKNNAASLSVTVPPAVSPYDALLLFATVNNGSVGVAEPFGVGGWTRLGTVVDESIQTVVWTKAAAPGDAGANLTVNLGSTQKMNLSLLAYTGTDPTNPVLEWAGAPEQAMTASHTTPSLTTIRDGSWIVSYWADKTSATTDWSPPGGETVRRETFGSGGGRITMLATDTGSSHPAGSYGGKTATANSSNSKATMLTVALNPVSETTNQRPIAAFTSICDALVCGFDGSDSIDTDGSVVSYEWDFGDGSTGTGIAPNHTYGAFGTYAVTLTVTDNEGASDTETADIHVTDPNVADIAFVGSDTTVGNAINHNLNVPANAQPGDSLVLFVSVNSETATVNDPSGVTGWTRLGVVSSDTLQTVAWAKVVQTGDPGKRLTVTLGGTQKTTSILAAYSGTDPTSPIHRVASAPETARNSGHTTPQVTTATDGAWIVSYWTDKTSATTAWVLPAGEVMRGEIYGTGGGRVTSILSDTGVPHPVGPHGLKTATANSANAKATMWTIALQPAS